MGAWVEGNVNSPSWVRPICSYRYSTYPHRGEASPCSNDWLFLGLISFAGSTSEAVCDYCSLLAGLVFAREEADQRGGKVDCSDRYAKFGQHTSAYKTPTRTCVWLLNGENWGKQRRFEWEFCQLVLNGGRLSTTVDGGTSIGKELQRYVCILCEIDTFAF